MFLNHFLIFETAIQSFYEEKHQENMTLQLIIIFIILFGFSVNNV